MNKLINIKCNCSDLKKVNMNFRTKLWFIFEQKLELHLRRANRCNTGVSLFFQRTLEFFISFPLLSAVLGSMYANDVATCLQHLVTRLLVLLYCFIELVINIEFHHIHRIPD